MQFRNIKRGPPTLKKGKTFESAKQWLTGATSFVAK